MLKQLKTHIFNKSLFQLKLGLFMTRSTNPLIIITLIIHATMQREVVPLWVQQNRQHNRRLCRTSEPRRLHWYPSLHLAPWSRDTTI